MQFLIYILISIGSSNDSYFTSCEKTVSSLPVNLTCPLSRKAYNSSSSLQSIWMISVSFMMVIPLYFLPYRKGSTWTQMLPSWILTSSPHHPGMAGNTQIQRPRSPWSRGHFWCTIYSVSRQVAGQLPSDRYYFIWVGTRHGPVLCWIGYWWGGSERNFHRSS